MRGPGGARRAVLPDGGRRRRRDPVRPAAGVHGGELPRGRRAGVDALAALHRLDPAAVGLRELGRPSGYLARQLRDAAEAVLRHIVLHPGAKIVNAWRDGLLAVARDTGTPMTKNEARARIAADRLDPALRRLRTWELPLAALRALSTAVPRSVQDEPGR